MAKGVKDEVPLRCAARAVLPRRADAPPGVGRAAHGHGRLARRAAPSGARGSLPALVGLVGAEAMLRLFVEEERNERAFEALTRFLDAIERSPPGRAARRARSARARLPAQAALALGYVPHLESCVECGAVDGLVGFLAALGWRRLHAVRARRDRVPLARGFRGMHALLWSPSTRRTGRARRASAARRALGRRRVVRVPRRLPASHADRVKRDLGDGYELDDDPSRIDRDAVHAYLGGVSYWAKGRPRELQDAFIDDAARAVGLYSDGRQVGLTRALGRPYPVLPRGRVRPRGAPGSGSRRRARPLLGRRGPLRVDQVVSADGATPTTSTASSASRSRASAPSNAPGTRRGA